MIEFIKKSLYNYYMLNNINCNDFIDDRYYELFLDFDGIKKIKIIIPYDMVNSLDSDINYIMDNLINEINNKVGDYN